MGRTDPYLKLTTGGFHISLATAVLPGGADKKGKSSHDDEYGQGKEKRRPSKHVKEKRLKTKWMTPNYDYNRAEILFFFEFYGTVIPPTSPQRKHAETIIRPDNV